MSRLQAMRVLRCSGLDIEVTMLTPRQTSYCNVSFLSSSPVAAAAALLKWLGAAMCRHARFRFGAPMSLEFCCGAHLALAHGEFVVLSGVRQQTLVCEAGDVWATLEGQYTDHLLSSGESLAIAFNTKVIVSASRPSVVRVVASSAVGCRETDREILSTTNALLLQHLLRVEPGAPRRLA